MIVAQAADALEGGFAEAPFNPPAPFAKFLRRWPVPARSAALPGPPPRAAVHRRRGCASDLVRSDDALHLAGPADCPAVRDWVAFHIITDCP